jgi:hypothetical protein
METHMRSASLKGLFLALTFAGLASAPALAGGLHDHVYADSFGNLIIHSPAGYKRIIVGEGHMADQLSGYTDADGPDVVYFDEADRVVDAGECYRPPWLLKGRSYMYGFDQGEIPFQGGPCQ